MYIYIYIMTYIYTNTIIYDPYLQMETRKIFYNKVLNSINWNNCNGSN